MRSSKKKQGKYQFYQPRDHEKNANGNCAIAFSHVVSASSGSLIPNYFLPDAVNSVSKTNNAT
jgi:hypothetical protein